MSGNTSRSSRRTCAASSPPSCSSAPGRQTCGGQRVGAVADHRVLAERTQHHRIVRVSMAGVGREQQLLLEPEVQAPMPGPVGEKRRARFGGGRVASRAGVAGRPRAPGDGRARARPGRPTASSRRPVSGLMPMRQPRRARSRAAASLTSGPRSVISQPAASGSLGTNAESLVLGSISSSNPRVSPRCRPHTTDWRSRTAARYGQLSRQ